MFLNRKRCLAQSEAASPPPPISVPFSNTASSVTIQIGYKLTSFLNHVTLCNRYGIFYLTDKLLSEINSIVLTQKVYTVEY